MIDFVRHDNKQASDISIFNLIRRKGPSSKSELSNTVGISVTSISKAIDRLIKARLIKIHDMGLSRGGRKPVLYTTQGSAYYSVGILLTKRGLEIILMDLNAKILAYRAFKKNKQLKPVDVPIIIRDTVNNFLNQYLSNNEKLMGIGLAIPGHLDRRSGIIIEPKKFPSELWNNVPIIEMIRKEINFPILIDNVSRASALAEYWYGTAKNSNDVVFLHVQDGIGCGIIINGRLLEEADTGAIGHMIVNMNGDKCSYGHNGCVETVASIDSMVQTAAKELSRGKVSILREYINNDVSLLRFDNICDAFLKDDDLSKRIILKAAQVLGIALANFINLMKPSIVIIGGETVDKCPFFYEETIITARKNTIIRPLGDIRFEKASLGKHTILVGAATQIFYHFFETHEI